VDRVTLEPFGIAGAFLLTPERRHDDRGWFARIYCERELAERGLAPAHSQVNTGFSPRRGTLRGMHYQAVPHAEIKIVRCTRGKVFDVIVDLRPDSPTYKRWCGVELDAESGLALYAPEGTAHGYLTLADDTELTYMTSRPYAPDAARGVHHADPAFAITWPDEIRVISQADATWPPFTG
jgi:dTDP-4-dehydrorhamnose 3,5-epimerase